GCAGHLSAHARAGSGLRGRGAVVAPGPVLGIDPGTRKCGYAIVAQAGAPPLAMGIELTEDLAERVQSLLSAYAPGAIALGAGTNGKNVAALLAGSGLPIHVT